MSDNAEHDIRKESKVMAGSSVDGGLRGKFYKLNVFAAEFVPRSDRLSAMTVVVDADPQLQQSTAGEFLATPSRWCFTSFQVLLNVRHFVFFRRTRPANDV